MTDSVRESRPQKHGRTGSRDAAQGVGHGEATKNQHLSVEILEGRQWTLTLDMDVLGTQSHVAFPFGCGPVDVKLY